MWHNIALAITVWTFINYLFVEFLWWAKPGDKKKCTYYLVETKPNTKSK